MKRLLLSLVMVSGLALSSNATANAETVTVSCGNDGATYSVQMPAGIALDGRNCSGSLEIDSRVKVIGQEAFWGSKLISVTIPASVTIIDSRAFHHVPLTSVTIPNTVTTIGSQAFYNTKLTSVTIPRSMTSIGSAAFRGSKLTSVTIPTSMTSIGFATFFNNPITSITIPNSVTTIGSYAFASTNLTSVTIPNSVTSIGTQAFYNTPLETVTIPGSVTSIGLGAFNSTKLTSVTIPGSVKTIGNLAFADIPTLKEITFPDGLLSLDLNVFDRDISLSRIIYCGALKGFPKAPTCPPEKLTKITPTKAATYKVIAKNAVAAKAAADQAVANAAPTPGTKCVKLGASSSLFGFQYTCIKSGKNLVWSTGAKFTNPISPPARLPLVFPPENSVSAITKPPISMQGINDQQFLWGGQMDPAFVTLGPKTGTHPNSDVYEGKIGVDIETIDDGPILAPIDARFIGFSNRNVDYRISKVIKQVSDGALQSPSSDLELCFESTSSDWPGLIFCFYHLGNTPLLLGMNKELLCSNAKEAPGLFRAEGWWFSTRGESAAPASTISATCKALLGRKVKRGDVIGYPGISGPDSQAPIKMKVQDKSINPTVNDGNKNFHWVQGDAFFYWKCYAPNAVFEQGVLAYPWECGGYKVPQGQRSVNFKYQNK